MAHGWGTHCYFWIFARLPLFEIHRKIRMNHGAVPHSHLWVFDGFAMCGAPRQYAHLGPVWLTTYMVGAKRGQTSLSEQGVLMV
jgi:hypothetical protein